MFQLSFIKGKSAKSVDWLDFSQENKLATKVVKNLRLLGNWFQALFGYCFRTKISLINPPKGGRPRVNNWAFLGGIIFVLRIVIPWRYFTGKWDAVAGLV